MNSESIWITGASSGIGKSAAKQFARKNYNVYASARRKELLDTLNDELKTENSCITSYPCNIAYFEEVEDTVGKILYNGNIDCLINNAGITSFKSAEENSIQEIQDIIEVNLLGAIYCIKAVLPHMIDRKKGTIINVLSVAAEKLFTKSSAYAASKAGLLRYADVLREEVRKYNIKVINVLPGATRTDIWPVHVTEQNAHRMMDPDEIAGAILSLYESRGIGVPEKIVLKPIEGDL